ncbi:hypothetical protein FB451DRAFT_1411242 [Mycena latifolia]|nr:hypothetical protein FB451DRAFT_1411242 [Mycena latifolia]
MTNSIRDMPSGGAQKWTLQRDNGMGRQSPLLAYIDAHNDAFIARLAEAVAIPSISGDPAFRQNVHEMGDWLALRLRGSAWERTPEKTVLVYGHFDVQPAARADGWESEPFVLTQQADGRLVGQGSSNDKGPVLGWLNVLQWHREGGAALPVDLVFCLEGMEESGREGLDVLVVKERDGWFKDVDFTRTPAVTYSLRGLVYFKLTVSGPAGDLHSGVFGRTVHEPMTDLIALMARLVSPTGAILVPGVNAMVPLPDAEEWRSTTAGAPIALSSDKVRFSLSESSPLASLPPSLTAGSLLLYPRPYFDACASLPPFLRRFPLPFAYSSLLRVADPSPHGPPALSLHGIEGAFAGPDVKTVIPARVAGYFSVQWGLPPRYCICPNPAT